MSKDELETLKELYFDEGMWFERQTRRDLPGWAIDYAAKMRDEVQGQRRQLERDLKAQL